VTTRAIRRIFPNFQFMDSTAQHLFARIAVSLLEGAIHIQEFALPQGRDGEGNWAGTKDFLKLLLRQLSAPLRFRQGGLGLIEIGDSFFEL
jgi:hypothetical protein